MKADVAVLGNAKETLALVTEKLNPTTHTEWIASFEELNKLEAEKVIIPELQPQGADITMGEVIRKISELTENKAVVVTDVGQNQMMAARYFNYTQSRSMVTSGGLGTMGFGLPAAIGAKIGAPERTVCMFAGDGGMQMTIQELGTIMQEKTGVKMIVLNNHFLGMVRQWQELFFSERYSETHMVNPDFIMIAKAYGIKGQSVSKREDLNAAIEEMLSDDEAYLLEVNVETKGMVYPMVPTGASISDMIMGDK